MARPKDLLGRVITRINLEKAWRDISLSARPLSHGISEQTIQDFRANSKNLLEEIRRELLSNTYQFNPLRAVTIDKKGGKKRPLRIADVRDRVVQRAITRVLETQLSKIFRLKNSVSHAYIKGRGVQSAIQQMLTHHQNGCKVILEADIKSFFDTVDRDKLLQKMIFPVLSDNSLNQLIMNVFEVEIGNKDDLPEEDWELYPEGASGLPQGGYLSPLFSNIYLSSFDQRMISAGHKLIRYADDFIVMCETSEKAEAAYTLALKILEGKLGLAVHPRDDTNRKAKTRVVSVSQTPIAFLGIHFDGSRIWPDGEKRQKLTYKMIRLRSQRDVRKLLNSANNLLQGWIAAYGFTDIGGSYAEDIDNEMNKHLWYSLTKMGWRVLPKKLTPEQSSDLFNLRWNLLPKSLDDKQRENSGVSPSKLYLDNIRDSLNLKDKGLFSKYWLLK
jgi:RNA-directed DNA polymerase